MTSYLIKYNRAYLKDLKKIPTKAQRQIIEKILSLASNPRPEDSKKLQGNHSPPLFRVRCGDYRIVYQIENKILLIIIIDVGHRKNIYRNLEC